MPPATATPSLTQLPNQIWSGLALASRSRDHPWRTPVLGTTANSKPQARTVILRAVDGEAGQLICFTDVRSAKAEQLQLNPAVVWVFYDPVEEIQLRAAGVAHLETDSERAERYWAGTPEPSHRNYAGSTRPGHSLPAKADALVKARPDAPPKAGAGIDSGGARANFGVLVSVIDALDWLRLRPDANLRARFVRRQHQWAGEWIAP